MLYFLTFYVSFTGNMLCITVWFHTISLLFFIHRRNCCR